MTVPAPTMYGQTLTVRWLNVDDGVMAVCDFEPGWSFEAPEYNEEAKDEAAKSVKRWHQRGLSVVHWAPA